MFLNLRDYETQEPETDELYSHLQSGINDVVIVVMTISSLTQDLRHEGTSPNAIPLARFRRSKNEPKQTEPLSAAEENFLGRIIEEFEETPMPHRVAAAIAARSVWHYLDPPQHKPDGLSIEEYIEGLIFNCENRWFEYYRAFVNIAFDCLCEYAFVNPDKVDVSLDLFTCEVLVRTASDKGDRCLSTLEGFLLSIVDFAVWMHKNESQLQEE